MGQLGDINVNVDVYTASETDVQLQNSGKFSGTAAGTDTYTISFTPAVTSYASGQRFFVIFTNANTGASTINVNGLGAKALTKNGSVALASGDIAAGQAYVISYDGTRFQILGKISAGGGGTVATAAELNTGTDNIKYASPLALEGSKYTNQSGSKIYATAAGTNTYTATLTPAIIAYTTGLVVNILFTDASTAAATLNLNGLGAKAIKRNGSKATKSGDILAGQCFSLMYDGTDFQMLGRVTTDWSPTALSLGDGIRNGATASLNAGAGIYITFDASSDDEILYNVALDRNGVPYDGSNIDVKLYWMKFGASGGTVGWELDYAFVNLGDDAYTAVDGTITNFVNVTALADQTLTSTVVGTISGPAGSKILQLTLRRNSTGAGADSYNGDAELYGFNLEK